MTREALTRFAWLSIAAALTTIVLKTCAWWLTGSVGLLSDALESLVNLATAVVALWLLGIAARPPDEEHSFGHSKAEYFAGGIEGLFILAAAAGIAFTAVPRLMQPAPLEQVGWGLAVSALAAVVNLVVGRILMRAGKTHRSLTLEAEGQHLMTDVWTSGGVIIGVALVAWTGWQRLDPLIALAVAGHICFTGYHLMRTSVGGLMDVSLPREERERVSAILERRCTAGVKYHALRTRQAGHRRFVYFHLLVPGAWSVEQGHKLMEEIEEEIRASIPYVTVIAHLEPVDDPSSYQDQQLDR